MPSNRTRSRIADVSVCLVLAVGTVLYVAAFPRNIDVGPDEARYLYESKRVLGGDVMYRDVFDNVVPGGMYLMAALFGIFGTTLTTARVATAVAHGGIVALIYIACRQLSVRRELAAVAAAAHLVVCQRTFAVATPHWVATLVCVALLVVLLRRARTDTVWSFAAGVLAGLIIALHQRRGLAMGLAGAGALVATALIRRWYRSPTVPPSLTAQLIAYSAGVVAVVVPLLVLIVTTAGFEPVWRALVIYPLVNYRNTIHCDWGLFLGRQPWQLLVILYFLKYLPLILAVSALRLLALCWRRREPDVAGQLGLLIVFCIGSAASITYFPDYIHIALIAAMFFVAIAETVEWALQGLPTRLHRRLGWALATGFALVSGPHLYGRLAPLRSQYSTHYTTAFGRIDARNPNEVTLYHKLDELLRDTPSRLLYCYRGCALWYLLLDARNPTRFEVVYPGSYTSDDHVREIIDGLAAAQVPYIIMAPNLLNHPDPISSFIRDHYEPLHDDSPVTRAVWQRKSTTAAPNR